MTRKIHFGRSEIPTNAYYSARLRKIAIAIRIIKDSKKTMNAIYYWGVGKNIADAVVSGLKRIY